MLRWASAGTRFRYLNPRIVRIFVRRKRGFVSAAQVFARVIAAFAAVAPIRAQEATNARPLFIGFAHRVPARGSRESSPPSRTSAREQPPDARIPYQGFARPVPARGNRESSAACPGPQPGSNPLTHASYLRISRTGCCHRALQRGKPPYAQDLFRVCAGTFRTRRPGALPARQGAFPRFYSWKSSRRSTSDLCRATRLREGPLCAHHI